MEKSLLKIGQKFVYSTSKNSPGRDFNDGKFSEHGFNVKCKLYNFTIELRVRKLLNAKV
jgi:hypothetical protein